MNAINATKEMTRAHAWFEAVAGRDTELLSDLLTHGLDIETLHPLRQTTALMEATRLRHASIVQWLLEHGAYPALLCGRPPGTALHCALRHRSWDVAHLLVNAMTTCAVLDGNAATPLHTLCSEALQGHSDMVVLGFASALIHKKCPLNAIDHEGTTALHHCVINDHVPLTAMLLHQGANPNALIPYSRVSPLAIAALEKNVEMARLLIHFGADPYLHISDGATPVSIFPALIPLTRENRNRKVIPKEDMRAV